MDDFQLSPLALSAGHRLQTYRSVGSTNQVAAKTAQECQTGDFWVVAGEQTAGRGRRGRKWQTKPGNLAASIAITLPDKVHATHLLGFVAAIAVAHTVNTLLPELSPQISLKWPNDVLLGKAKLSGILLEAIPLANNHRAIVIGMGVNVSSAPTDLPYEAAYLQRYDRNLTAAHLFEELTKNWVEVFSLWDYDRGRHAILDLWRQLASGLGQPIIVQRINDSVNGTFSSIDDEGRLTIVLANGQKEIITAGDVTF